MAQIKYSILMRRSLEQHSNLSKLKTQKKQRRDLILTITRSNRFQVGDVCCRHKSLEEHFLKISIAIEIFFGAGEGFEPSTSTLARLRSTPELRPHILHNYHFKFISQCLRK